MSIIRAKNKSIFIEKNFEAKNCACSEENNLKEKEVNIRGGETEEREETAKVKMLEKEERLMDEKEEEKGKREEKEEELVESHHECERDSGEIEVFGLFAGLANLPNLSTLALGRN